MAELVSVKQSLERQDSSSPTTITVTITPKEVELKELARLTRCALDALAPFCQVPNEESKSSDISQKALVYVGAINSSIAAAQYGYTVSEDIITLSESLKAGASDKDLSEFAEDMLLKAQNAHRRVDDTLSKFRNVRQEVLELINDAKAKKLHTTEQLKKLEDSIRIFTKLSKNVSMYAEWWTSIRMSANTQVANAIEYKLNQTPMRQKANIRLWRETKRRFLDYTQEITRLKNSHAQIFQIAATDSFGSSSSVDIEFLLEKSDNTEKSFTSHEKFEPLDDEKKETSDMREGWLPRFFRKLFCLGGAN